MNDIKKIRLVLFSLYLFIKKMVSGLRKEYNKFEKNNSYGRNKN